VLGWVLVLQLIHPLYVNRVWVHGGLAGQSSCQVCYPIIQLTIIIISISVYGLWQSLELCLSSRTLFNATVTPSGWKFRRISYFPEMSSRSVCRSANWPPLPLLIYILARVNPETTVPADILLVSGTCIVNEAMLSGESTPLLKESIQLSEPSENLDVDGTHKNAILFSGTKILQASKSCNPVPWPLFHPLFL